MAPPDRMPALMEAIEASLFSPRGGSQQPTPRAGLGGGFKIHHGRRVDKPLYKQLPGRRQQFNVENRAPLYQPPRRENFPMLEDIMERRQQQFRPSVDEEETARQQQQQQQQQQQEHWQRASELFWHDVRPTGILAAKSLVEEINAVHASLPSHSRKDPTVTQTLLMRIGGGGGSKIDYSALRAELQQQQGQQMRSPRRLLS